MGGHGGLNILPQKKWNVYNPDNRLKVAKDEAAHAAKEAEKQRKQSIAEAEARLTHMRQRSAARMGRSEEAGGSGGAGDVDPRALAQLQAMSR